MYLYGMKSKRIPPMAWIPTLYVAEGLRRSGARLWIS